MSDTFPITENQRRTVIVASAAQVSLAGTFPLQGADDVVIVKTGLDGVETTLAITTHYTLSGVGSPSGFTATLVTPAVAGELYQLDGVAKLVRTTSIVRDGKFASRAQDDEHDRHRLIQQELRRETNSAVKAKAGVTPPKLAETMTADRVLIGGPNNTLINGPTATEIANAEGNAQTALTKAGEATAAAVIADNAKISAMAAASASGNILFYDTYAAANAALGSIPANQLIEVNADETKAASRTRYRKEGGVLVYKVRFPGMGDMNARSVLEFGVVPGVNSDAALIAAAAAARRLYIPAIDLRCATDISASTAGVLWIIDPGATFPAMPTVGPLAIPDLARLGGRIEWAPGTYGTGSREGAGSAWLEAFRNYSITLGEKVFISPSGGYGAIGASRQSDNPAANFNTIGLGAFAYIDNIVNKEPGWAGYDEAGKLNLTGACYGREIDCWDASVASDPLTPYKVRSISSGETINLWLSAGGGIGSPGLVNNSAGIGFNPNGRRFDRGIVYMNNAIDATINEAMTLYKGLKLAWYDSTGLAQSFIHGDLSQFITKSDTAIDGHETQYIRKRANGTTATGSLDEVHVDRGAGWDGSAVYFGTYVQHLQRTAFSSGNARFSVDIGAKNAAGVYREISLNGLANDSFSPSADNVLNLGAGASFRWKEIFCANPTVNTSDANLKTDIRGLTEAERRVALACKGLFRAYRWKDAVAEKGDGARIHFGVIAQEVEALFLYEGLDPWAYGLLCRDEIEILEDRVVMARVQKTEPGMQVTFRMDIIDGKAVKTRQEVATDVPVEIEMPVWNADGSPAMEPIFETRMVEVEVNGKTAIVPKKVEVGERQAVHVEPVMIDVERVTQELVKTGEYRMGVRYSELFAFILAAESSTEGEGA